MTKSKRKRGTTYFSAINCHKNKIGNQELSFFCFPMDKNRSVVIKVNYLLPILDVLQ